MPSLPHKTPEGTPGCPQTVFIVDSFPRTDTAPPKAVRPHSTPKSGQRKDFPVLYAKSIHAHCGESSIWSQRADHFMDLWKFILRLKCQEVILSSHPGYRSNSGVETPCPAWQQWTHCFSFTTTCVLCQTQSDKYRYRKKRKVVHLDKKKTKECEKEVQSLLSLETDWRAFSLPPWSISLSCEKPFWSILRKKWFQTYRRMTDFWHIQDSRNSWEVKTFPDIVDTSVTHFGTSSISTVSYLLERLKLHDKLGGWDVLSSEGTTEADRTQETNISQGSSWVAETLFPPGPCSLPTPISLHFASSGPSFPVTPNPQRNLAFLYFLL